MAHDTEDAVTRGRGDLSAACLSRLRRRQVPAQAGAGREIAESSVRRVSESLVPPELREAFETLVRRFGRSAVQAAAEALGRRAELQDGTREERAQTQALVGRIERWWDKRELMKFLQRAKGAKIPWAICNEVLGRVADYMPKDNPWAFISKVMREDYPHYRWGRANG